MSRDGSISPEELAEVVTAKTVLDEVTIMGSDVSEPNYSRRLLYADLVETRPGSRGKDFQAHLDSYLTSVCELAGLARQAVVSALAEANLRLQPEMIGRHVGMTACQNEAVMGRTVLHEWYEYQNDVEALRDFDEMDRISASVATRFTDLYDLLLPAVGNHPAVNKGYKPLMEDCIRKTLTQVITDYDQMLGNSSD